MKKLALIALLTTLSSGALAHSRVNTTTPENGAVLAVAPAEVTFDFASDIRLTRVEMTHEAHPSVQLELGEQKSFDRVFILPLEGMGSGIYLIEWRGLGIDGHAMQGEFTFTVE